jgi:hypothetical protein
MIRPVTSAAVPPRHLLGLAFDIGHGQAAKIFAGEFGGAAVFRSKQRSNSQSDAAIRSR